MKKNFIQSHLFFFSIVVFLFVLIPGLYDTKTNALDKESAAPSVQEEPKQEEAALLAGKKVMLDSGHGGYDDGSVSRDGTKEKNITLAIALKVKERLQQEGAEVVMTRESDDVKWPSDNALDLRERSAMANASQADCFVSIHTNFSDVDASKVYGSEVWLSYEDDRNIALAEALNKALEDADYTYSRGLKDHQQSLLSLLYYNEIPSVLVETGFLSNDADHAVLTSEAGQEKIADALAEGIREYLLLGEDR